MRTIAIIAVISTLAAPDFPTGAAEPSAPSAPPKVDELYQNYNPNFSNAEYREGMKYSLHPTFYNKSTVTQDKRVDALIREGIKCESTGDFREAIKHFQHVLEKFPDSQIQVSDYGVFVPAALYVQQRLLSFPAKELAYYRMLYDPEARTIYEQARALYSVEGLRYLADNWRATSYGAKALFDLGSRALDRGHPREAREFYECIRDWFPAADFDASVVKSRLDAVSQRLEHDSSSRSPGEGDAISFGDYGLFAPLQSPLSVDEYQWKINLPRSLYDETFEDKQSGGELIPFHHPWVVGNSVYVKHYNRIFCLSLITGAVRWQFDLGPINREPRIPYWNWHARQSTLWHGNEDVLVDEGSIYANVRTRGNAASLVVLDSVTGNLRWAAGPVKPRNEQDLTTCYDAPPVAGRLAVYAPWICNEDREGGNLATRAGLAAFDKETGNLLWRRELCDVTPNATTQERRHIRLVSSPPLLHEDTLYHVTNAGVVAAVDVVSGSTRWLMRYPHVWNADGRDAHDELHYGWGGHTNFGGSRTTKFDNRAPLLKDGRLYVAPFDSENFLCLDPATGKVLWNIVPLGRFVGITRQNELVFACEMYFDHYGRLKDGGLSFHDAKDGSLLWKFNPNYRSNWGHLAYTPPASPGGYTPMAVLDRPILTSDDKISFSTSQIYLANIQEDPFYAEWYLSTETRKLVSHRVYYSNQYRSLIEAGLKGMIKDNKNFEDILTWTAPQSVNAPFDYEPVKRMPLQFHGVPVELVSFGQALAARYDPSALTRNIAAEKSPRANFTQAELLLVNGHEEEAIAAFEKCKAGLRPEETQFIREIDRELFRLYQATSWKALLAGNKALFHTRCLKLAETATTVHDEIEALLAVTESYERQGDVGRAIKCLQNLALHYQGASYAMPSVLLKDPAIRQQATDDVLKTARLQKPGALASHLAPVDAVVTAGIPSYFSAVAPLDRNVELDADVMAARLIAGMTSRHSDYKAPFEKLASDALAHGSLQVRANEIGAYPGTDAAQKVLDEMLAEAEKQEPMAREQRLWDLVDLGARLNLKVPADVANSVRLSPMLAQTGSASTSWTSKNARLDDAGQTMRLVLQRRHDDRADGAEGDLIFLGGRSKKLLDNKFSLACWDARTCEQRWEIQNIRLKGRGDESGFEEVLLAGGSVITHGKFDVLAFGLKEHELRWRFRVPFDFNLKSVDCLGNLLIVSGDRHTLALQCGTGAVVWETAEQGEVYGTPFLREGIVVSVRREPFAVSFRQAGSGRLIKSIYLPDLSMVTKHPVLAEDVGMAPTHPGFTTEALPVACDGNLLLLTDKSSYLAIDLKTMDLRWKREIDNCDTGDAPMRFYIHEPYVAILKRDFTDPALYLLDSATGAVKWMKKGREVLWSIQFDRDGKSICGIVPPESEKTSLTLKAYDLESNKQAVSWTSPAFDGRPDAELLTQFQDGQWVLEVLHEKELELIVLAPDHKAMAHRLSAKIAGPFGVHGGTSAAVQNGHLVELNSEQLSTAASSNAKR